MKKFRAMLPKLVFVMFLSDFGASADPFKLINSPIENVELNAMSDRKQMYLKNLFVLIDEDSHEKLNGSLKDLDALLPALAYSDQSAQANVSLIHASCLEWLVRALSDNEYQDCKEFVKSVIARLDKLKSTSQDFDLVYGDSKSFQRSLKNFLEKTYYELKSDMFILDNLGRSKELRNFKEKLEVDLSYARRYEQLVYANNFILEDDCGIVAVLETALDALAKSSNSKIKSLQVALKAVNVDRAQVVYAYVEEHTVANLLTTVHRKFADADRALLSKIIPVNEFKDPVLRACLHSIRAKVLKEMVSIVSLDYYLPDYPVEKTVQLLSKIFAQFNLPDFVAKPFIEQFVQVVNEVNFSLKVHNLISKATAKTKIDILSALLFDLLSEQNEKEDIYRKIVEKYLELAQDRNRPLGFLSLDYFR